MPHHFSIYNHIAQLDTYRLPQGTSLPHEIQGGAFYKGELYLASNIEDAVWKVFGVSYSNQIYF